MISKVTLVLYTYFLILDFETGTYCVASWLGTQASLDCKAALWLSVATQVPGLRCTPHNPLMHS